MKKKIIVLILIVIISFVLGFCVNHFIKANKTENSNSIFVIGTIVDITDNLATIKPKDAEISSDLDYIKFNIPDNQVSTLVIGDIVKLEYFLDSKADNFIEIISLESIGKERLFNNENLVPVSNADHRGNGYVFKSFFAYDNSIVLDSFNLQDDLYYKKIITYSEYEEYKKLIPELRTLTENDFINYYLVIAMSKSTNYIYMFNDIEEKENSISLELLKNQTLSEASKKPLYSGVAIILPNVLDVPVENIEFTIGK